MDATQTSFLLKHWIRDNILAYLEEISYSTVTQQPGVLVFLDFKTAFHCFDRAWVERCSSFFFFFFFF